MREDNGWQVWSDDRAELVRMIEEVDSFHGDATAPPGVVLKHGERLFCYAAAAQLVEMRHATGHSVGASSGFSFRIAKGVSWRVGRSRGTHLPGPESCTPVDEGAVYITDRRVVFAGSRQARDWSFANLLGVRHEETSPVTWLPVSNRQRVSGLAYGGDETVRLRFMLALAQADSSGERGALKAQLVAMLAEHDVNQPSRAVPAPGPVAAAATAPSPLRRVLRVLALVYTGKPGHPVAVRAGQGALAGLLTLALLGGLAGSRNDNSTQSARDRLAATELSSPEPSPPESPSTEASPSDAVLLASPLPLVVTSPFVPPPSPPKPPPSKRPSPRPRLSPPPPPPPPPPPTAGARLGGPFGPGCQSAYPDFCIPQGRDYNCPEIPAKRFTSLPPDPYRLDADHDGIACES